MARPHLLFAVMATTLSACSQRQAAQAGLTHDGTTREYILHVPASYDAAVAVPLVINFHGGCMDAASQQAAMDMRPLANEHNFILVYPEGLGENGASCQIWNSGPYQDPSQNKTSADDLGFTEALVRHISSTHSIDQDRIYATGFSNGGFMTYALACYKSDIFAAFAPIAAMMQDEELSPDGTSPNPCRPTHPTPVIHLHGSADGQVNVALGETAIAYWRAHNQITNTTTTRVKDGRSGAAIERYSSTGGTAGVEYYKFIGGEHDTFNDVSYEGANSSELIWDFVSQYRMSDLQ